MKKTILMTAFAVLVLSAQAFAGTIRDVADCSLAQPSDDGALDVTIAAEMGTEDQSILVATVSRQTDLGTQLVGQYNVHFEKPAVGLLGSRGSYVGDDFYMGLPLVPANDGKVYANLAIAGNLPLFEGVKISENLLCTLNN